MTAGKSAATLNLDDVLAHSVWRYKIEESLLAGEDESWIEPVNVDSVDDAYGHFFATSVTLADGSSETAIVGGTEPHNSESNEQVQFFVFFRSGKQCHWHPVKHPGTALANFLGLEMQRVFPFTFSIRRYLVGDPNALERTVSGRGSSSEA